ncbi:MAG: cobalamin biosynthesis protein P47K [Gemmataceae bacterium]|nr:cobalamin biosynthesis protein P47K [Gemmataceae bacterium]
MRPQYIMIGGFLGAGKTTTVSRLAKEFIKQGKRVAIVTNDQAADLVDTHSLRSQGFAVGEVAGACFCCNFNQLTQAMESLSSDNLPEIFLAEPVGSCTDLVATVLRPLEQVYGIPLDISPYGVILKPSHGKKILEGKSGGGFTPKAEYIFKKQIEEADFILLNRIDELEPTEVSQLENLLRQQFPGKQILKISAKTGLGFDALHSLYSLPVQDRGRAYRQSTMELDYDIYAEGEAELGWLNCQVEVSAVKPFLLDSFLLHLIQGLNVKFIAQGAEAAHLKTIGLYEGFYAVANLVSNETGPELSLPSGVIIPFANVVINARVGTDPVVLEHCVRDQIESTATSFGAKAMVTSLHCFRPGRPIPTHRIGQPL